MKKKHKSFKIEETGLWLCESEPFIAASPDILTNCTCHGRGLCEIKSPYTIRNEIPSESNYSHLEKNGDNVVLSKKSQYYYQIQGQMGVLQVQFCDFFVYTSHGHFLDRVNSNADFWDKLSSKLCLFWRKYIANELLCSTLFHATCRQSDKPTDDHVYTKCQSNNNPDDHIYYRKQTRQATSTSLESASNRPLKKSKFDEIFLCGVCGDDIQESTSTGHLKCNECKLLYHFTCLNYCEKDAQTMKADKWLCPPCQIV